MPGLGQTQVVDNVAVTLGGNSFLAIEGDLAAALGSGVTVTQAAGTAGRVGASYHNPSGTKHLTSAGTLQAI